MKTLEKRITAIDVARGMSVLLMIIIHTMLIYGDLETQTHTILGKIVLWLGRGTAMFLITMGISFVLSRRQSFTAVSKRALYILGIGYGMNVLKFIVPEFVFGGLPTAFVEAYGLTSQTLETTMFFLLLGDILQLAGITLFLMALINHFSSSKYVPLLIATVILFVSKEVSGFRIDVLGINYICDLFFSDQFNVYFPVFPWSAFILIGMFLGRWYKETNENKALFFKNILKVGLFSVVVGGLLNITNPSYHFADYYHLGPGGTILLLGVNLLLLWIINKLVVLFGEQKVIFKRISFYSKNVTSLYVIQWVIINWGMCVFGFWEHQQGTILLLIPLMILLTTLVQIAYSYVRKQMRLTIKEIKIAPKRIFKST